MMINNQNKVDALAVTLTIDELYDRLSVPPGLRQDVWLLSLHMVGQWHGERVAKAWYHIAQEHSLACFIAPTDRWRLIGFDTEEACDPTHAGIEAIKQLLRRRGMLFPTFIWPQIDDPAFEVGYLRTCLQRAIAQGDVILLDDGCVQLAKPPHFQAGPRLNAVEHYSDKTQSGAALQYKRDWQNLQEELASFEWMLRETPEEHFLERVQLESKLESLREELAELETKGPSRTLKPSTQT